MLQFNEIEEPESILRMGNVHSISAFSIFHVDRTSYYHHFTVAVNHRCSLHKKSRWQRDRFDSSANKFETRHLRYAKSQSVRRGGGGFRGGPRGADPQETIQQRLLPHLRGGLQAGGDKLVASTLGEYALRVRTSLMFRAESPIGQGNRLPFDLRVELPSGYTLARSHS